ncbi:OsmC family protein [Candidatus Pacearchaeota archaeon]|nr:OsmC family protein [Candidatus Pacearchaeota archaeon]
METKEKVTIRNGVDVTALEQTIAAIKEQPDIAEFKFRAKNKWVNGGNNRTTIEGFYGAKEEHAHKKTFVIEADEPEVLLGEGKGAGPAEFLLVALSACVTTGIAYHAAARGFNIESIESSLDGDVDLRGFLGLSDEVRKGFKNINLTLKVKGDASADQLKELTEFSPILDSVTNPVAVNLKVEKV